MMDKIIEVIIEGHYIECGKEVIYTTAPKNVIKELEKKVPNLEKLSKEKGEKLTYEEVAWYTLDDFIKDLEEKGYLVFESLYSETIILD